MRVVVAGGAGARALAEDLRRDGAEVLAVVPAAVPAAVVIDATTDVAAAELIAALSSADVLVVDADRDALTAELVATCDRFGVRIVARCARAADRRLAERFGVRVVDVDAEAGEVLDPAVSAPVQPTRRGRVIVVWGAAGAPGRTTVALALAAELARDGRRVALVDADSHAPSLAVATGLADEGPGFAAACRQAARGALSVAELERIALPLGDLTVLTGINRPGRWPELAVDRVQAALAVCRDWVDDVVVDVAASLELDEEIVSDLKGTLPAAIDGSRGSAHNTRHMMEKTPMKRQIGAYARISYDRNGEERGTERQHEDNDRLAAENGWTIVDRYTDNNVSAYKRSVVRPEFERMVRDLESGRIQGVVAYNLDRLWRQPRDLERMIELFEEKKDLVFATTQSSYDLSKREGRVSARIMVTIANDYSAGNSEKVRRSLLQSAQMGKPHWSTRPYGWNMDGTIYEPEAAVLSQMVRWFLSGYSYREVTFRLNEAGMVSRSGAPWYNTQIKKLLVNPRLAAIRVHDGEEYPGAWEPLLSLDEWRALQDTIKIRREAHRGTPNNRRYLLTGLLVCAKCENYLCGMNKRDAPDRPLRPTYQCATTHEQSRRRPGSCGGMCVGAEPLDHFIKECILYRLDSVDLAALLVQNEDDTLIQGLAAEAKRLSLRRSSLLDDYTDGTLTKPDYKHAVTRVDAQLADIYGEMDSLRTATFDPALSAGETLREAWESRPDGWRRELIEILIESITIHPSSRKPYYVVNGKRTRFDAERVEIKWRA